MDIFVLTNPSTPLTPSSYVLVTGSVTCSSPKSKICYIIASNDGNNLPVIDSELIGMMALALNNGVDQTRVKLKA